MRPPLRVLALAPEGRLPPESLDALDERERAQRKMEFHVAGALAKLRHEARWLEVRDDLAPIRDAIEAFRPSVVLNLLEDFHGQVAYDMNVASFLELLRVAYTGCNPRGLVLARDKALTKKILSYHRIGVPGFAVFPRGRPVRPPRRLRYPMIVKSLTEEGSFGIAQDSVVTNDERLARRVEHVHEQTASDAVAEEYIEGREVYLAVLGNSRLRTFPPWELVLDNLPDGVPRIATERIKSDPEFQARHGIVSREAKDLSPEARASLARLAKRVYRVLHLSGYARIDLRLAADGRPFVLEANPNPDISADEDFAEAAAAGGVPFPRLVQSILDLGLGYRAAAYR